MHSEEREQSMPSLGGVTVSGADISRTWVWTVTMWSGLIGLEWRTVKDRLFYQKEVSWFEEVSREYKCLSFRYERRLNWIMAWTDTAKVKLRKQVTRLHVGHERQKSMLLRLLEKRDWVDFFFFYPVMWLDIWIW